MKTKLWTLFFGPDDGAPGGGNAPPHTGDGAPPTPPAGEKPPENPPPANPPAAPAKPTTILGAVKDEGTPPASGDKPPENQPPQPPDQKQVSEFLAGLKVDYGKDAEGKPLPGDSKALERLAPVMLKHKVSADAASEIIQTHVLHQQEMIAAWQKQNEEVADRMAEQTQKELGADLPRFAAEAVRGGRYLFGDELWAELKAVPHFSNDVRVVKALAALGRTLKNDPGPGGAGGGNMDPKDFADAWISSSNRKKE